MKKSIIALLTFLLVGHFAQAQDDGAKLAKKAGKALTSYNIDPVNNGAKLEEAKTLIEQALQMPDAQGLASAWITKGDIYNTLYQKDETRRMIDKNATYTGDNDPLAAFEAYKKALSITEIKKYERSDALKGIADVQNGLSNVGIVKYEKGEYGKAYQAFYASLDAHEVLKAADKKSALDDAKNYDNQVYVTTLAAMQNNDMKAAGPLLEKIYTKGTDKPEVYSGLYKYKLDMKDEAGAAKVLDEGRKKFPDDPGLLFDEINAFLKADRLNELTDRLKMAIQKEPTNIGLYVTLGNVYDRLVTISKEKKDDAKAAEYLELAKKYYSDAIARDPRNLDAQYALGAMYYNMAAAKTQELNALPEDFSSAGMKRYAAMKDEIMKLFESALPYFQSAESIDGNDVNTLIALNEIYARKEDELSIEFKKRLEVVKGGGKNPSSYFKK